MVTKTVRNIVRIDEEKCNGCGACIVSCAEGALKIIDGKAKLIGEKYCDGLGNCLDCPQGAISIEEREAEEFDEAAVEEHLRTEESGNTLPCGCSSAINKPVPAEICLAPRCRQACTKDNCFLASPKGVT